MTTTKLTFTEYLQELTADGGDEEFGDVDTFGRYYMLVHLTPEEQRDAFARALDAADFFTPSDRKISFALVEDDQGNKYVVGEKEYRAEEWRYAELSVEEQEREDAYRELEGMRERLAELDVKKKCEHCSSVTINGVFCHEPGCYIKGEIEALKAQIKRMEYDL